MTKDGIRMVGLAQIPLLLGLLIMAVAIPVATKLSQQSQDTRNRAYEPGATCSGAGGSCYDRSVTECPGGFSPIGDYEDCMYFDVQGNPGFNLCCKRNEVTPIPDVRLADCEVCSTETDLGRAIAECRPKCVGERNWTDYDAPGNPRKCGGPGDCVVGPTPTPRENCPSPYQCAVDGFWPRGWVRADSQFYCSAAWLLTRSCIRENLWPDCGNDGDPCCGGSDVTEEEKCRPGLVCVGGRCGSIPTPTETPTPPKLNNCDVCSTSSDLGIAIDECRSKCVGERSFTDFDTPGHPRKCGYPSDCGPTPTPRENCPSPYQCALDGFWPRGWVRAPSEFYCYSFMATRSCIGEGLEPVAPTPTEVLEPTDTPRPTATIEPTNTPEPTDTPRPTSTRVPTSVPTERCFCMNNCRAGGACRKGLVENYGELVCDMEICNAAGTPIPTGYVPTAVPGQRCFCMQRCQVGGACRTGTSEVYGELVCDWEVCATVPTGAPATTVPTRGPSGTVVPTRATTSVPTTGPVSCKKDITGADNPACCCSDSDCPVINGVRQMCNIPNGFCQGGLSCNANPSGRFKKKCAYDGSQGRNICAEQAVQPGEDPANECESDTVCNRITTPIPTPTNGWLTPVPTNPPVSPTSAPASCQYRTLQVRVQKDESVPWSASVSVKGNESYRVGCFHDSSGQLVDESKVRIYDRDSGGASGFVAGNLTVITRPSYGRAETYQHWCESTDTSCSGLRSDMATAVVGPCSQCPSTFRCYAKDGDKKWFAPGYQMDGYQSVAETQCSGIAQPGFKGKQKGDANCDGLVDSVDYSVWRKEYLDGLRTGGRWEADFTGPNGTCDGIVNTIDYSLWRMQYIDFRGGN